MSELCEVEFAIVVTLWCAINFIVCLSVHVRIAHRGRSKATYLSFSNRSKMCRKKNVVSYSYFLLSLIRFSPSYSYDSYRSLRDLSKPRFPMAVLYKCTSILNIFFLLVEDYTFPRKKDTRS